MCKIYAYHVQSTANVLYTHEISAQMKTLHLLEVKEKSGNGKVLELGLGRNAALQCSW